VGRTDVSWTLSLSVTAPTSSWVQQIDKVAEPANLDRSCSVSAALGQTAVWRIVLRARIVVDVLLSP